jgi:hypothetical protein
VPVLLRYLGSDFLTFASRTPSVRSIKTDAQVERIKRGGDMNAERAALLEQMEARNPHANLERLEAERATLLQQTPGDDRERAEVALVQRNPSPAMSAASAAISSLTTAMNGQWMCPISERWTPEQDEWLAKAQALAAVAVVDGLRADLEAAYRRLEQATEQRDAEVRRYYSTQLGR